MSKTEGFLILDSQNAAEIRGSSSSHCSSAYAFRASNDGGVPDLGDFDHTCDTHLFSVHILGFSCGISVDSICEFSDLFELFIEQKMSFLLTHLHFLRISVDSQFCKSEQMLS